jgi:hypothetical protein
MTTGAKTIEGAPVKPSTGRIVHYVSYGTPGGEYSRECRAAIVTEVVSDRDDRLGFSSAEPQPDAVGLCVLNPTGQFFNRTVLYDAAAEVGGTWHWPERAE